jgi:hypothetical protein
MHVCLHTLVQELLKCSASAATALPLMIAHTHGIKQERRGLTRRLCTPHVRTNKRKIQKRARKAGSYVQDKQVRERVSPHPVATSTRTTCLRPTAPSC